MLYVLNKKFLIEAGTVFEAGEILLRSFKACNCITSFSCETFEELVEKYMKVSNSSSFWKRKYYSCNDKVLELPLNSY